MVDVYAIASLAGLGLVFGSALGYASKKLAVESDPRKDQILAVLPGANCGACGFPGCSGLAEAIAAGKAPVDACPVGKKPVAEKVAAIMGVQAVGSDEPKVARVRCQGGREQAKTRYEYVGIRDCTAASLVADGFKSCTYGCLGFGTCVKACPFDAIHMGDNGLPIVDEEKCTACGKCVTACPRDIIVLAGKNDPVEVMCVSHMKGAEVRKACSVGCIGCGLCAKNCPRGAITMVDGLAVIDHGKCDGCAGIEGGPICVAKCPTHALISLSGNGKVKVGLAG